MAPLFLLLVGHAVCDYPLQGDFLAKGKNHKSPIPGIPFWECLIAHSLIHAGAVFLITQNLYMALGELALHAAIDYAKCDGRFGFNADQAFHVACKILWASLLLG